MNTVLETKSIRKEFGTRGINYVAVDDISLKVEKGDFLGIMGPSGAGKTSLLNMLSTIDKPSLGEIYYEGQDIVNMKNKELAIFRRENVGFIFQDFNLLDSMTIEDNIALPLTLSRVNPKIIQEKVKKLGDFLGISNELVNIHMNYLVDRNKELQRLEQ